MGFGRPDQGCPAGSFAVIRVLFIAALMLLANAPANAEKRIALSFDDIPRQRGSFFSPDERTKKLIAALKQAKVKQAAFFLNPGRLAMPDGQGGEARINAYVAAGHVIANHSFSHPGLGDTNAETYLADIDKAVTWLSGRAGYRPWFRFPYLHEGGADKVKRDAVRAGLAVRGLRNGYVTADGSDWFLDDLVNKAKNDGKELDMEQLRRLYIRMHVSNAEAQDDLARQTLSRSPAHVMLMHETDIAALFLPDLVAELRRHGWNIITADQAYLDPLNRAFPDTPNARGDLISALAVERKMKWPLWPIPIYSGLAEQIFNERVIKKVDTK
jgi:peptidoglycan-N-acetylglucosamine deacetylase